MNGHRAPEYRYQVAGGKPFRNNHPSCHQPRLVVSVPSKFILCWPISRRVFRKLCDFSASSDCGPDVFSWPSGSAEGSTEPHGPGGSNTSLLAAPLVPSHCLDKGSS